MSQQQRGDGLNTGKEEQGLQDFCVESINKEIMRISLDYKLSQVVEQIKLLQGQYGCCSPVGYWCTTTMTIVHDIMKDLGINRQQPANNNSLTDK